MEKIKFWGSKSNTDSVFLDLSIFLRVNGSSHLLLMRNSDTEIISLNMAQILLCNLRHCSHSLFCSSFYHLLWKDYCCLWYCFKKVIKTFSYLQDIWQKTYKRLPSFRKDVGKNENTRYYPSSSTMRYEKFLSSWKSLFYWGFQATWIEPNMLRTCRTDWNVRLTEM